MKLKEQVCSLELAKKLKELGVKQESLWWWSSNRAPAIDYYIGSSGMFAYYSAFTVAELGALLKNNNCSSYFVGGDTWEAVYFYAANPESEPQHIYAPTEADTRAKMLIYLIENKLL